MLSSLTKYTISALVLLFTNSLFANDTDYSVSGSSTKNYSSKNIKIVELNCYCSMNISITESSKDIISLKIEATDSSVGYHGQQDTPSEINPNLMEFIETQNGNRLILTSKEYTYIHHSFIIYKANIKLPSGVSIKINPIGYNLLEGRDANSK